MIPTSGFLTALEHQIRFWSGLRTGPRWESLQRSPTSGRWFKGALLLREERKRKGIRERRNKEGERKKGKRG